MKTIFYHPEKSDAFYAINLFIHKLFNFIPAFYVSRCDHRLRDRFLTSFQQHVLFTFSGRLSPNRDHFVNAYTCIRAEINRRPAHQQRQCRELNPKIDILRHYWYLVGCQYSCNFVMQKKTNDDCIIIF